MRLLVYRVNRTGEQTDDAQGFRQSPVHPDLLGTVSEERVVPLSNEGADIHQLQCFQENMRLYGIKG